MTDATRRRLLQTVGALTIGAVGLSGSAAAGHDYERTEPRKEAEVVEKRPKAEVVEKRPKAEPVEKRPKADVVEKRPKAEVVEKPRKKRAKPEDEPEPRTEVTAGDARVATYDDGNVVETSSASIDTRDGGEDGAY